MRADMTDGLGAYIDAAAATLGLKITAEQRTGRDAVLRPRRGDGRKLEGLPLHAADESGNVFVPVAPEGEA